MCGAGQRCSPAGNLGYELVDLYAMIVKLPQPGFSYERRGNSCVGAIHELPLQLIARFASEQNCRPNFRLPCNTG